VAYSAEILRGRILSENAEALGSLQIEGVKGPALSDDISAQSIVARQSARLRLI
jgi:hypothetical protein